MVMNKELINIKINTKELQVSKNLTVLQACELIGLQIPKFCFHKQLSIAGNCRMCLVEIVGSKKPMASCALPLMNDINIITNSKLVKKAREGIMEFLLANHPLDCPICDQGGECDLQDQSLMYGGDKGRFYEYKRAVEDKDCGPLIKTLMTRCIHCTRCVRYGQEIAGVNSLGTIGRGQNMEISTFLSKVINSEVSGNVIDLCPVGALTSKPYAFKARSWELKSEITYDLLDSMLPPIRIDIRDRRIKRILPSYNKFLENSWINDKTRFSYDGIFNQRLGKPFLLKNFTTNKNFLPCSWSKSLKNLYERINNSKQVYLVIGEYLDIKTGLFLKEIKRRTSKFFFDLPLFEKVNFYDNDFIEYINSDFLPNYMNTIYIILNVNIRKISPLLNINLKKNTEKNLLQVFNFTPSFNSTYGSNFEMNSLRYFTDIFKGKHDLCTRLKKRKIKKVCFITDENSEELIKKVKYSSILKDQGFVFNNYIVSFNSSWLI